MTETQTPVFSVKLPPNLGSWLLVLAGMQVSPIERNLAAMRVLSHVRSWVGPYLRRSSPCLLDEADLDEVVQHLLTRCSTGSSRFRGTSEGEAHKWCMRVLLNRARDLCRNRRRLMLEDSEQRIENEAIDPDLRELTATELGRILQAVVEELARLHRPQDLEGLERSLRCQVEARLGATIEEQMEAYGFSPDESRSAEACGRARNRVYKYRERGRSVGCEALSALVAQGRFDDEEVVDLRRLLGCGLSASLCVAKGQLS